MNIPLVESRQWQQWWGRGEEQWLDVSSRELSGRTHGGGL